MILHTNLGRAPLGEAQLNISRDRPRVFESGVYLAAGARGKRMWHVDRLFRRLLTNDAAGTLIEARGFAQAGQPRRLSPHEQE